MSGQGGWFHVGKPRKASKQGRDPIRVAFRSITGYSVGTGLGVEDWRQSGVGAGQRLCSDPS